MPAGVSSSSLMAWRSNGLFCLASSSASSSDRTRGACAASGAAASNTASTHPVPGMPVTLDRERFAHRLRGRVGQRPELRPSPRPTQRRNSPAPRLIVPTRRKVLHLHQWACLPR